MAPSPDEIWHIERLTADHDRSAFACGEPSLDGFLKTLASQYDRKGFARTYVAVLPPSRKVVGYYALCSGSVAFSVLPESASRKLPRHPVPVAHLGRLAVDQSVRGIGLGETLLLDALKRCKTSFQQIAMYLVEVYALNERARAFYLKYGFASLSDDPLHLYLPISAIQKPWGE